VAEEPNEEQQPLLVPSEVEDIKRASNHLRLTVKDTLGSEASHFSEEEYQILKFHGVYQQENRDTRAQARKEGRDKDWIMMIRAKIPGGTLTADQYVAFDEIATRYANDTLRATTRQCFQLHYVSKGDLKETIRSINDAMITTLGACGDVERNLMACPAPDHRGAISEVQRYARILSDETLPKTRAYHEIWLDHEKVFTSEEPESEPLYGDLYLPRKYKSAIVIEGDNCIDVYSNDVGMVAHIDDDKLAGFTFLVGGGMGMTHTDRNTRPRVGDPICFVEPDDLVETFLAILKIQRDHGNRYSRRQARLKYLIAANGIERFKRAMESWVGHRLAEPRPLQWRHTEDHLGWHDQYDGRSFLGVWIENGRIQDSDDMRMKSGFRALVDRYRPGVVLTPNQNILFTDINRSDRASIEDLLRRYGIPLMEEVPMALRYSMACPAVPTCGLALAESERALPTVVRRIEAILSELGLENERMSIRMTGCPNGCARPFLGDIGFVGRTVGRYQMYVGGDFEGTRLSKLLEDMVKADELPERLRPLLAMFRDERRDGEGFGDFCNRVGMERLHQAAFPEKQLVGAAR
jgi:sulfite reductase (ferredoxin)